MLVAKRGVSDRLAVGDMGGKFSWRGWCEDREDFLTSVSAVLTAGGLGFTNLE